MKIKKQRHFNKKIALTTILIGVIVLVGVGTAVYALLNQTKPIENTTMTDYESPTTEQIEAGTTTKSNSVNTTDGKPSTTGSDQPNTPAPESDGSKSKVVITIPNSPSNSSGSLRVSTSIAANTATGTCTLELVKSGESTVTQTAGVQPLSTYATCKGFEVSGLASGDWQATVTFENDTLKGTVSTTVTVM
jgi:cytoskeletal protein RodZ